MEQKRTMRKSERVSRKKERNLGIKLKVERQ